MSQTELREPKRRHLMGDESPLTRETILGRLRAMTIVFVLETNVLFGERTL
jgi:hypothetical protein